MNIEYQKQLLDSNWKRKRRTILKRDNYRCRKCNSKSNLQVHHTIYVKDRKAWEYTNNFLITLCSDCHSEEHKNKKIKDFVTTDKKKIKISNPHPKKKKKKIIKKYSPNLRNTSWYDLV